MEQPAYEFGPFRMDLGRMTVVRDGTAIALEPKAFDVLAFLVQNRDRLVSKEELLDAVWADTFVTPNVLTRAVAQIRRGLGDETQHARYIETLPKRGYRFIAPVTVLDSASSTASLVDTSVAVPDGRVETVETVPARPRPPIRGGWIPLGAVLILIALGAVAWMLRAGQRDGHLASAPTDLHLKRLTSRRGYNGMPTLSPDGRAVVYASDASGGFELYLSSLVEGSAEVPLTSDGGQNVEPAWSPDGQWIAFHSRKRGGIWVVGSTGGTPQQIVDFGSHPAWAPDSTRIAFTSDAGGLTAQSSLWVVQRDGTDRRPLTKVGAPPGGHRSPSWSHDGRFVAFTIGFGAWLQRIDIVEVATGKVTNAAEVFLGADPFFGADDRTLYFGGSTPTGNGRLFRLALDGRGGAVGKPEVVLPMDGNSIEGVSMASNGTLAFTASTLDANLWAVDFDSTGHPGPPRRLTDEATRNSHPDVSVTGAILYLHVPVGEDPITRILRPGSVVGEPLMSGMDWSYCQWAFSGRRVFVARRGKGDRGGETFGWIDAQSRAFTPTTLQVGDRRYPRLSPDEKSIAFHRVEEDVSIDLWTVGFDGVERKIASDPEAVTYPSWSRDGKWIAVELKRGDSTQIGAVSPNGGPVEQLTTDRGQHWPDSWAPDNDRIAFAGERDGVWNLFTVSRTTRVVTPLTSFTSSAGYVRYPNWSPSGSPLVFERALQTGQIWTITLPTNR